jgi:hypothetical protein
MLCYKLEKPMQNQTQEQMQEIGDALAIALDAMDENAIDEPMMAARIQTVRTAMEELQLLLDRLN